MVFTKSVVWWGENSVKTRITRTRKEKKWVVLKSKAWMDTGQFLVGKKSSGPPDVVFLNPTKRSSIQYLCWQFAKGFFTAGLISGMRLTQYLWRLIIYVSKSFIFRIQVFVGQMRIELKLSPIFDLFHWLRPIWVPCHCLQVILMGDWSTYNTRVGGRS